jgi:hypothetical protein
MPQTVHYLPGYGGRLTTGQGEGILQLGLHVAGQETVGIPVTLVENAGHILGKTCVGGLLDRWLPNTANV